MYKKLLSFILVLIIVLSGSALFSIADVETPSGISLQFAVNDAISTPDGSFLFLLAKGEKSIYKINTLDFSMESISFDLIPEKVVLFDGKLFVALCAQIHSSYWRDEDQYGAFAIVDANSLTIEEIYDTTIDPYDIAVTKDGFVCISSGSGQWTYFHVYNQNGELVSSSSIRQESPIKYNKELNVVYTITTDSSPRNMTAYKIGSSGEVISSYGWPYHGGYPMGVKFTISPDGAYIFNEAGTVLSCSNNQSEDMEFKTTLNINWVDLTFSDDCERFFAAICDNSYPYSGGKQIYAYDYTTFEGVAAYETKGYPQHIFSIGNTLLAISKKTLDGSMYFIETIDLDAPDKIMETETSSKPLLYNDGHASISAKANTKTIMNENIVYIADEKENAVFIIDTEALTETKIKFPNTPTAIDVYNNELYIGFGDNCLIYILDASTYTVKDKILTNAVFLDLSIGHDGYIYIIEKERSPWWDISAYSFSADNKQMISSLTCSYTGKLERHPVYNSFYFTRLNTSPTDIHVFTYDDGILKNTYKSIYHGDYSMDYINKISPDGKNIFNSSGNVFRCSSVQSEDIIYKNKFVPFKELAFYGTEKIFVSGNSNYLDVYDYNTYKKIGYLNTFAPISNIFVNSDSIIAISSTKNDFYLEILDINNIEEIKPIDKIELEEKQRSIYFWGDDINLEGMKIKATYEDGSTREINITNEMITGYENYRLGTQEVIINFEGKEAVLIITVNEIPLRNKGYIANKGENKSIGVGDAIIIFRHLAGKIDLYETIDNFYTADINGNNRIELNDAIWIFKLLANKISESDFPCYDY